MAEDAPLDSQGPARSMRERMLAGELYLASDPELVAMSLRARQVVHRFNHAEPTATRAEMELLHELFGSLGKGADIRPPFSCDYGQHIHIGERFFANGDCVILDCAQVRIGDGVMLGPKVQLYAATHPLDPAVRREGWELARPITIGSDVWIGGGAIVCPGVTLGSGTTIGAGSVVTRDIPAHVVAAGNPCRVIRHLETPAKSNQSEQGLPDAE